MKNRGNGDIQLLVASLRKNTAMLIDYKLIKKLLLGLLIALLFLNGCVYPKCSTAPESLRFGLISKKDSTDLISSGFYNKDSIMIWYLNQNQMTTITFQIINDSINKKSIISLDEIGWLSADDHRDFYIRLNQSDIDTIYLNEVKVSGDKCTSYQISSFKYNGQESQIDKMEYNYIIKK